MERFSKEITVGTQKMNFMFTLMRNINGVKFFVTSMDGNKKTFSFSLFQKEERNWKLMPGSLRWLYEIEGQLSGAIVDNWLNSTHTDNVESPVKIRSLLPGS